jgi:hypothetical protein
MNDEELVTRLRASAQAPAEADSPQFWQRFGSELDQRIARGAPRRPRRLFWMMGLVAAAAAALLIFRPTRPAPHPNASAIEDALIAGPEDPCELIGDLDSDELEAIAHHLQPGA